jgi:hypothetical protein
MAYKKIGDTCRVPPASQKPKTIGLDRLNWRYADGRLFLYHGNNRNPLLTVDPEKTYLTEGDDECDTAEDRICMCNSIERTGQLFWEMAQEHDSPHQQVALFLQWSNTCDAPFPWRRLIAEILRGALKHIRLEDVLAGPERTFFEGLGAAIPIYRGCQKGCERGLHWTTDRAVAMEFAIGKRCTNQNPTLVSAYIPKEHVFGVFLDRGEYEIAVDPRRLRRVMIEPGSET